MQPQNQNKVNNIWGIPGLPDYGNWYQPQTNILQSLGQPYVNTTTGQYVPAPLPKGVVIPTSSQVPTTKPVVQAAPAPTPQVNSFDDIYKNFYGGWGRKEALADYNKQFGGDLNRFLAARGGSNSGNQNVNSWDLMISDAYGPAIQSINDALNSAGTSRDQNLANVNLTEGEQRTAIEKEQANLADQLATQSRGIDQSKESAYSEALRYANALKQQSQAQYGQGSSAGPAITDLINAEFMRSQGKLQQGYLNSQDKLRQQGMQMENYISQKLDQLSQWKRDAQSKIQENYNQALLSLNQARGGIEANKTNAKLALLQQSVQQAQQIAQQETQVKSALAQWSIQQLQQLSGRSFTVPEILGYYNQIANGINTNFLSNRINSMGINSLLQSPYRAGYGTSSDEDILKQTQLFK